MQCIWCGHRATIKDYLVYPGRGPVPEGEANQVSCCLACKALREGRSVASWLSDCRESGRPADPREIYRLLRELDQNFHTSQTEKELNQLRRALDLQFKAPVKRRVKLGELFERAGSRCIWCGRALSARHLDSSYEHLIPKSKGGSNHPDNLLPACMHCNGRRSNRSPAEWIDAICQEGSQPRVDLVWESLVRITGPDHGVRMHRRATEYLDQLEQILDKLEGQPYMPQDISRPPVAPPKRYRGRKPRRQGG